MAELILKIINMEWKLKLALRVYAKIKISNEKQLSLTDTVRNLYLYVCFIEIDQTEGATLQEIVDRIREILVERSQRLLLRFNDLLLEMGFKDGEYVDKLFFVHEEKIIM